MMWVGSMRRRREAFEHRSNCCAYNNNTPSRHHCSTPATKSQAASLGFTASSTTTTMYTEEKAPVTPMSIAAISAGFDKVDFLVREEQGATTCTSIFFGEVRSLS